MSSRVVLVYGAGANVGAGVLKKFAANGWKTAAVVRTLKDEYRKMADVVLQADFADHRAIQNIYADVESKLGTPNCVVYNAHSSEARGRGVKNPFLETPDKFARDMAVNTTSMYAAASAAAAGFAKLADGPKVFIFTGNCLPTLVAPELGGLGAGKAASAFLIEAAAKALDDSHWYFGDERLPDGWPVLDTLSGELHGDVYYKLATAPQQGPWNQTFAKGRGYFKADDTVDHGYLPVADMAKHLKEFKP